MSLNMQIAEQILPHSMKAGTAFMDKITQLIEQNKLMYIIETGCYLGDGTTAAINRALTGAESVYSIEVNPGFIATAQRKYVSIEFLLGLSIPRDMVPDTLPVLPDHVIVDHEDKNRLEKYAQEIDFNVPDCKLLDALMFVNFHPDLVILDSAGHIGWEEFNYLLSLAKGEYYIALDDTNHIKHYRSVEYIKSHPEKFEIIWQTDEKFGSCIVKVC